MKKKPKVSIIIPLYNTEKYIEECLKSILKQSLPDLEIIIIDDGSTDRSVDIVKEFIKFDIRFSLFIQNNHGAWHARNKGISLAKGEYVMFLDCDDWLNEKAVEYMYEKAISYDADIVTGNVICYNNMDNIYPFRPLFRCKEKFMAGCDFFTEAINQNCFVVMLYNYMYKSKYLKMNNFQFYPTTHEDEIWTPQVLILAERIVITNIYHYFYRQRQGSITHIHRDKSKNKELLYITKSLLSFSDNIPANKNFDLAKDALLLRLYQLYHYILSLDSTHIQELKETADQLITRMSEKIKFRPYIQRIMETIENK